MKPDIHPNYHMIKVVMTNGVEFMTRSTYGEDGATLHLDIDPNTHPAWTGGSQQLLANLATITRGVGPAVVSHYNARPVIDIYGSVDGTDLGTVAAAGRGMVEASRP